MRERARAALLLDLRCPDVPVYRRGPGEHARARKVPKGDANRPCGRRASSALLNQRFLMSRAPSRRAMVWSSAAVRRVGRAGLGLRVEAVSYTHLRAHET